MKRPLASLGMNSISSILETLIEILHTLLIYIPLIMSLSFGTNHITYSTCAKANTNVLP
jgi:hypothetical protein